MADLTLYKSTCINGLLIMCALLYGYIKKRLPLPLIIVLLLVIVSSLINHTTSNIWLKWGDRILATIALTGLAFYIIQKGALPLFLPLVLIIGFYFLAKYWKNQDESRYLYAHCVAHILATILVVGLLFS
uniref:Uncharacterized protein n=1 Tax=viral metagenome TaxID=1070528 RepID=A0A6C0B6H3_9ZZZZ